MYVNGQYDQAASIVEGIRLGKEVLEDESLHTLVILRRYDNYGNKGEAMYGVHAYGDQDDLGYDAFRTVGLMNADYIKGVTDAIHLGAKWGFYPAEMVMGDVQKYVLHNICPIEWHKLPLCDIEPRVVYYTRDGKTPRKPDTSAFQRRWGKVST